MITYPITFYQPILEETPASGPSLTGLLYQVTGAMFAYSQRDLRGDNPTYGRVVFYDGSYHYNYPTVSDLYDDTLLTWAGANTVYAYDVYDQSDNGYDLTFGGTFLGGPRIIETGVYDTYSGFQCLHFDAVNDHLYNNGVIWPDQVTVVWVGAYYYNRTYSAMWRQGQINVAINNFGIMPRTPIVANYQDAIYTNTSANTLHCITSISTETGLMYHSGDGYVQGTQVITGGNVGYNDITQAGVILGARDNTDSNHCPMRLLEFIAWSGDRTADLPTIFADIQAYYGIDMS